MTFRAIVLVGLFAACGDDAEVVAVPLVSGDATLALSADRTTLTLTRGDTTLVTLGADAFVVGTVDDVDDGSSFDPYWLYDNMAAPPSGLAFHQLAPGDAMHVVRSDATALELELRYRELRATVTFQPSSLGCFSAVLASQDTQVAYYRLRPEVSQDNAFYGLGEWGDSVEHRGKLRPMQIEVNLELESSYNEDHVPVPLLIGTQAFGVFVKSMRAGVFDVARVDPDVVEITFGTGEQSAAGLEFHLLTAAQPLDVLAHYYEVTGFPGLPAPWAYGPLLWRDENANQAQVLADIQEIRTRKLPTSGIWFDRPYATGVNTFDWSATKFPDPTAMLTALHDAGLRYGIWQAPYAAPANNSQDPAGATFDYASSHGFFPPTTAVIVNHWSKPIDFTNPAAYAWWQSNLEKYTDPLGSGGWGVEGFKLDYGEDVVLGLFGQRAPWLFADGSDERTMHYGYTMLYHQIHREVLPQAGGWLLTRTGRWGDQTKGMIIWPGDLDATFAKQGDPIAGDTAKSVGGLPAALTMGIGLSASGFPFYSSDTAGYRKSPAAREVWIRWVEANAVSSAMEVGDSSDEQPWEFTPQNGRDQLALDTYQRYASLHLRLWPYAWTLADAMRTDGRPLVRPFGLAHPELGVHPSDQFMFGDALLVAPVVAAGQTSRSVMFPAGTWVDWWTGVEYTGGAMHVVPADLYTLPLFVRRGGIVPMLRDGVQTLSPVAAGSQIDSYATDAGDLWVRIAPGPASTLRVFDGATISQEPGKLSFARGSAFAKGVVFELIATTKPAAVMHDGMPLVERASLAALLAAPTGWFHDAAAGGTLWIKVDANATITFGS